MSHYLTFDALHPIEPERFEAVYALLAAALPPAELRREEGQRALLRKESYHLLVLPREDGSGARAFMAYWTFEGLFYIEHLAVDDSLRGQGIGGLLLEHALAHAQGAVILEVDPPDTEIARRRIGFYERHGLTLCPAVLMQPPLRPDTDWIPLRLMIRPGPIDEARFTQIRRALYAHVYGISGDSAARLQ